MNQPSVPSIPDLDDGPYDIEFFFDPGCPFAWQTSVWLRRVVEMRGIRIGWRFISLPRLPKRCSNLQRPASWRYQLQRLPIPSSIPMRCAGSA